MSIEFKDIIDELWRDYTFADGLKLRICNVVRLSVGEKGTHRLETAEGDKWIVPPTWIAIKINAKSWTI